MTSKIAFLFLAVSNIFHEPTWIKFFAGQEEYYSLYVHSKWGVSHDSFFARSVILERRPTSWENTMKAQRALLKEALKDFTNEKFVFLSESTIPLMPFQEVYSHLMAHPNSEFSYYKNMHKDRTFGKIKDVYKNPQWIVLNRKHAQLIVDDNELINVFAYIPFDNEHYPATFLAHKKVLHEVVNRATTFVIWSEGGPHPHLFQDLKNDRFTKNLLQAIEKKFLFARKFAADCDLSFLHPYIPILY